MWQRSDQLKKKKPHNEVCLQQAVCRDDLWIGGTATKLDVALFTWPSLVYRHLHVLFNTFPALVTRQEAAPTIPCGQSLRRRIYAGASLPACLSPVAPTTKYHRALKQRKCVVSQFSDVGIRTMCARQCRAYTQGRRVICPCPHPGFWLFPGNSPHSRL